MELEGFAKEPILCAHPHGKAQQLLWIPSTQWAASGAALQQGHTHGFVHLSYAETIRTFQAQHFFNAQYFLYCLRKMIQHYFCLVDPPVNGGRDDSLATLASLCSQPGRWAEPKQDTWAVLAKKICHLQSRWEKTGCHLRNCLAVFNSNKPPHDHHHLKPF